MTAVEATGVTVDEVKERMGRVEQFTSAGTRNPQAWGEAGTKQRNRQQNGQTWSEKLSILTTPMSCPPSSNRPA